MWSKLTQYIKVEEATESGKNEFIQKYVGWNACIMKEGSSAELKEFRWVFEN